MGYYAKGVEKCGSSLYFLFRVLAGLLFFFHGGQKLFGWFGGAGGNGAVTLVSLFGLAGIIEFLGGLVIVLGLFSRLAATIAAVEMLIAFFMMHFPQGWNPLLNMGEAAVLYFAAFLVLIAYGNGRWSLEQKLLGKEVF